MFGWEWKQAASCLHKDYNNMTLWRKPVEIILTGWGYTLLPLELLLQFWLAANMVFMTCIHAVKKQARIIEYMLHSRCIWRINGFFSHLQWNQRNYSALRHFPLLNDWISMGKQIHIQRIKHDQSITDKEQKPRSCYAELTEWLWRMLLDRLEFLLSPLL